MPSTLFELDEQFTHHVMVVDKATHSLYLYQNNNSNPKLLKKYKILTGKFTGNKQVQGDKKTPEGVYFFQQFHSSQELLKKYGDYGKIYGAGAFTMNYPNTMDLRAGKTGGGIWLHSTDDDNRISLGLDSKGCVVAINSDLKEMSQYIDLGNTATIIVQDLHFLSRENWNTTKKQVTELIENWQSAWQNKDFKNYISSYSKKEFKGHKGGFQAFKTYKSHVFSRNDKPVIEFSHRSILSNGEYIVVTMQQDYTSPVIKDIGKKTLYLKRNDNYEWKIVAEEWSRMNEERNIAFTPKMRYFQEPISKEEKDNDS